MGNQGNPELEELRKLLGEDDGNMVKINIIIAGQTGVGKSTLMSAIVGKPIKKGKTEGVIEIPSPPIYFYDTEGLEVLNGEKMLKSLLKLVKNKNSKKDINERIHIAYYCISEQSDRVQPADKQFVANLGAAGVQVILVLTKSYDSEDPSDIYGEAKEAFPQLEVIRVNSIPFKKAFPDHGVDKLLAATQKVIPLAQKVTIASLFACDLKSKKIAAGLIIASAAALAGGVAGSPIPFLDLAVTPPAILSMIAGLNRLFGVSMSTRELMSVVMTALATSFAAQGARIAGILIGEALQFIPIVGSIVGGIMVAGTVASSVALIGGNYVSVLIECCEEAQKEKLETISPDYVLRKLDELRNKTKEEEPSAEGITI